MTLPPLAANAWLRWDVTRRLVPDDARTVLEVGCGGGGFGARLSVGRDYLGVEPDATSSATARARVTAAGAGGEVRTGAWTLARERFVPEAVVVPLVERVTISASPGSASQGSAAPHRSRPSTEDPT